MGAGARSVAGQVLSIMINIATFALRIIQTIIDSTYNDEGELVFDNFSLLDKSVSCSKLLFVSAYHAALAERPLTFAFECTLGSSCVIFCTIMIHLNRNYRTWAMAQTVGMANLLGLAVCLLHYGMVIPMDHVWHTVAAPSIICSLVWLEVVLVIRQIKEDEGNQHLLHDLLMKLFETPINIYRCVDLIQNPDSPWVAQKILLLLGSGPPMIIGACQIGWIVYKDDIISKVRSGILILIRTCQDRWTAYKTGITFKVVGWLGNFPWVFAGEEDQADGAAAEGYRDGGARDKEAAQETV